MKRCKTAKTTPINKITSLPPELISCISNFLDLTSAGRLTVCHSRFAAFAKTQIVGYWPESVSIKYGSAVTLQKLQDVHGQVQTLTIDTIANEEIPLVARISSLKQLTISNLHDPGRTSVGLACLHSLYNLTSLKLIDTAKHVYTALPFLRPLKQLKHLDIYGCYNIVKRVVQTFPHLTDLVIRERASEAFFFMDDDLSSLSKLPLVSFCVDSFMTNSSRMQVALVLSSTFVQGASQKIKILSLPFIEHKFDTRLHFQELDDWLDPTFAANPGFQDSQLTNIQYLTHLHSLNLSGHSQLRGDFLSWLPFKSLKSLDIPGTSVTDENVMAMINHCHSSLIELNVCSCPLLTDAVLSSLTNMKSLTRLELASNVFSSIALFLLLKRICWHVHTLNLADLPILDSFGHLFMTQSPALCILNVSRTFISYSMMHHISQVLTRKHPFKTHVLYCRRATAPSQLSSVKKEDELEEEEEDEDENEVHDWERTRARVIKGFSRFSLNNSAA